MTCPWDRGNSTSTVIEGRDWRLQHRNLEVNFNVKLGPSHTPPIHSEDWIAPGQA